MTGMPSEAQIRAQVQSVREKYPEARAIGIRVPPPGPAAGPAEMRIGGETLPVIHGGSVLALRERLAALPDGGPPLVVLTHLPPAELGADLVARLARRKVIPIDNWLLVKERFRVRDVDPRLVERHDWAAGALLEAEPKTGYPPVPSGFLDAETAWGRLLEHLLGIPGGEAHPEALLAWALVSASRETWGALSEEARSGLATAAEASAGATARTILECAGRLGRRAVAVGLVARVLFDDGTQGGWQAMKARGKLEALLGLRELDAKQARAWSDAAERVVRGRLAQRGGAGPQEAPPAPDRAVHDVLADADDLLRELGATDLARPSAVLRAGLDRRLADLAGALTAFVEGAAVEVPAALRDAADAVCAHALAVDEPRRREGVRMALRLAGWLAAQRSRAAATHPAASSASAFRAAADAYRAAGGFVDWARTRLWGGDSCAPLAAAYAALAQEADRTRHEENRAFAGLLAHPPRPAAGDDDLLGVEALLDRRVAPLARLRPVLLLVIDAMSMAVFRELEVDLVQRGWVEWLAPTADAAAAQDGAEPRRAVVLAALPSVTEASRTSLLCGAIRTGNAKTEREGFCAHPSLRAASSAGAPPLLFHKGDLQEAGAAGVPRTVLDSIADPRQRVVGVVVNAVDDHLMKGDQVRVAWTLRHIRPLEELLEASRAAGRVVVLASDHGHILERETELRSSEGGERWRAADGAPAADEVRLEGPRVALGGGRLLAPWSERVRYAFKKNGYHGGAALQEVVVPFAVFASPEATAPPAGWCEAPPEAPAWWREPGARADAAPPSSRGARPATGSSAEPPTSPATGGSPRQKQAPGQTADLFSHLEPPQTPAPAAAWIDRLLATDLFASQRKQAARTRLPDARIRAVLTALDAHGGKLTTAALAEHLGVPPLRVAGVVGALRRILNVDGYAVLTVDESSATVELNRRLLDTQFGLADDVD